MDLQRCLTASSPRELRYHLVQIAGDGVQVSTFDTATSLLENFNEALRTLSGQPARVLVYSGGKVEHTTPQVMVGLQLPGRSRPEVVMLKKGTSNTQGTVPDRLP